jgi:hypothetical protein
MLDSPFRKHRTVILTFSQNITVVVTNKMKNSGTSVRWYVNRFPIHALEDRTSLELQCAQLSFANGYSSLQLRCCTFLV